MPSRASDILRTFLGIAQLQQEYERIDDARTNARVAGINTFMTLARQTDNPAHLTALVDRFSQLGIGSKDQLLSILQNVTPTQEAVTAGQTKAGVEVARGGTTGTKGGDTLARRTANAQLTGQNAAQLQAADVTAAAIARTPLTPELAAATTSQALTHMTPGALVLDAAITRLPGNEQEQAAGVGVGTRLSAGQSLQKDLGFAGLRETARHDRVGEALAETGQMVDLANAQVRAGQNMTADASDISSLLATKSSMVKQLTETKGNPTPGLVLSYIGALNSINRQLTAAGIPNEGQIPYDPALLVDPSYFTALKRRLAGGASTPAVISPSAPRPRTQGQSTGTGRQF